MSFLEWYFGPRRFEEALERYARQFPVTSRFIAVTPSVTYSYTVRCSDA